MAVTSELIGRLGGADVEKAPISFVIEGDGASELLLSVDIPAGETWLVAIIGEGVAGSDVGARMPRIVIGDTRVPQSTGHFASAAIMDKSFDVEVSSGTKYESSFTGHIYTVKM